jgi:hypothetical protein
MQKDIELGTIGNVKTNTHAVKVLINEWNGELGVDLRRWFKLGSDWKATTKGIRLRPAEISEAITYLERAEQEMKKLGKI